MTVNDPPGEERPYFRWDAPSPPVDDDGRYVLDFAQGIRSVYGLLAFTENLQASTLSIAMDAQLGISAGPAGAHTATSGGVAFTISGTPAGFGDINTSFSISDDRGNVSAIQPVVLRVRPNPPPNVYAINPQEATAGTMISPVPVRVSNSPEGETVTLTYRVGDSGVLNDLGLSIDKTVLPEAGADVREYIRGTVPLATEPDDYVIHITANDGYNDPVTHSFVLRVNRPPTERRPTIEPVTRLLFAHGEAGSNTIAVSDGDEDESKTVVCVVTGLPDLMTVQAGSLSSGAWTVRIQSSGNVVIQSGSTQESGEWACSITATISGEPALRTHETFIVEVSRSVVPEIAEIHDHTFTIDDLITPIPVVVDNLPAGEALTVVATGLPTGLEYRNLLAGGRQVGEIHGIPTAAAAIYNCSVQVTDAAGNSDTEQFSITLVREAADVLAISGFGGPDTVEVATGSDWDDILDGVLVTVPAGNTATLALSGGSAVGLTLDTTNVGAGATRVRFSGTVRGSGTSNAVTLTATGAPTGSATATATYSVVLAGAGQPILRGLRPAHQFYLWTQLETVNIPLTVVTTGGRRPYLYWRGTGVSGLALLPPVQTGDPNIWLTAIAGQVSDTATPVNMRDDSVWATYDSDIRPPGLPGSGDLGTQRNVYPLRYRIWALERPTIQQVEPQTVRRGARLNLEVMVTGTADVITVTQFPVWVRYERTSLSAFRLTGRVPLNAPLRDETVSVVASNRAGEFRRNITLRIDEAWEPPFITGLESVRYRQGEGVSFSAVVNIPFQGAGVTAVPRVEGPLPEGVTVNVTAGNRDPDRRSYPRVHFGGRVAANARPGAYQINIWYTDDRRVYRTIVHRLTIHVLGVAAEPLPPALPRPDLTARVFINTDTTPAGGVIGAGQVFTPDEEYTRRVIGEVKTMTGRARPADFFGVEGDSRAMFRLWNNDGALDPQDFWVKQCKIILTYSWGESGYAQGGLFNGYVREATEEYMGPKNDRYVDIECYGQLRYWSDALTGRAAPLQIIGTPKEGMEFYIQLARETVADTAEMIDVTGDDIKGGDFQVDFSALTQRGVLGFQSAGAERVNLMGPINLMAQLNLGSIWDGPNGEIVHHSGAWRLDRSNRPASAPVIVDKTVRTPPPLAMRAGKVRTDTAQGKYVYTQISASDNTFGEVDGAGFPVDWVDPLILPGKTLYMTFTAPEDFVVVNWGILREHFVGYDVLEPTADLDVVIEEEGGVRMVVRLTNSSTTRALNVQYLGPDQVTNVLQSSAANAVRFSLPADYAEGDPRRVKAFERIRLFGEKTLELDIVAIQNEEDKSRWLQGLLDRVNYRRKVYDVRIDGGRNFNNNLGILRTNPGDYVILHLPSAGVDPPIGCWVEAKETSIYAGRLNSMRLLLTEALAIEESEGG